MRYSVLGPTQVHSADGSPVALGGARLRSLLTALALRADRTVPVGSLVAEVWPDDPPADEIAALQALVGRLRRALGREAVVSGPGGYRLAAADDDVDARRFERLVGEGTRALEAGDPARAACLLDEALGLWRGPALADLPDRTAEAARWEARRLDARRARHTAALALGEAASALPELAALCEAHPLDEPLQALRIRALRATGRAAEALAAYESFRRALADSLGADPSPELRALHGELLAQEPEAPATRAAARPPARLPARTARPGNLRARLTSFVGRDQDIARLQRDLRGSRLVTLLGPGGAGKTRLSQEAGERAADAGADWPDGVWLAELAPVTDPEAVAEAVLGAVGARETVLRGAGAEGLRTSDDALTRLVEHCASRRLLLILDNCEHVVGAAAELVDVVLARCPGVTVLATSREPLGVPGEFVRPLEPLPQDKAVRLLADRGAAARPGFDPGDDPEACGEICRRLDGLPLAIELAAARLRVLSARQVADRLDDRFRLLTSGARTVLPRQQTLRAVVDWSWDLLTEAERGVLRRLSVFSGGCDLEAVEAVCPAGDALGLLGSLVDKSLVVAAPCEDGPGGGMRYRLLETVAEYAGERLDEAGDRAEAERRHLVHYRELARHADPALRGPDQVRAMTWFRTEYENLRTALRRAVAARDEHEALVLVHCLVWYWQMRDLRADALHWAEAVAALGPDPFAPPAAPVEPLHEPCTAAPPPLSEAQLWEARRGVRLIGLLNMDHMTGDWTSHDGIERLKRITAVYRPGLPQTCRLPGTFAVFAVIIIGEPRRMRELLDATVDACRRFGYTWELAGALQLRANMLAHRVDSARAAADDADESLELFVRLGDSWGAAEALSARGDARERQLRFEGAAEDYVAAIGYAERIGAQSQMTLLRARYADMLSLTGRAEEAEAILRQVVAAEENRGHEPTLAARLFLAMLLGRTGRTAEARVHLNTLMDAFSSATLSVFGGFTLGGLAWLDNLDGRYASALGHSREALDRSRGTLSMTIAPQMPAIHLITAAWALAGLGGPHAMLGARLLGAHVALLPEGHLLSPPERDNLERATELARSALGDGAFEAAYAEGGGLSVEEAAALLERADAIQGRAE
ncbi:BTAD domain-containing putative transcriptional regulator [Streptomyces sp. NPDC047981]|uniref:BTAD domain-containing putative transcriptional regulator n=1 Tax=Streptomyces sp. NPDC047981 TaxID=3154610 RepID=UPI0034154305